MRSLTRGRGELNYDGPVAEKTLHTWTCPGCGRRVPLRVEACHCGATRAEAEARAAEARTAGAALVPRPSPAEAAGGRHVPPLPTDVKALAVGSLVVLVGGLIWLVFVPSRPSPILPVLGYADAGPPPVVSTAPPRPPFKLPWWK